MSEMNSSKAPILRPLILQILYHGLKHSGASQATQLLLIQAMQTWYWCNLGDKFNAKEQLFNSSRMAKWSKALSSWTIDHRFESCLGILHFFPIFPNFRVPPGVSGTSRVRGNLPIITYGFRSTTTYGLSLRIPAYSWCHFHIENSNFRALKIMFFYGFLSEISLKLVFI